ncbi:hypothetical protein [Planococcus plakortidis]|uniref:hypothetical protein n=1 Tax=Planococcus plakortidis TaxID=1038856 RepID=UPI00385E5C6C
MFGLSDLIALVISAFIILPVVVFIREAGYLIVSFLLGAKNPRLTIGSGPRVFKIGMFDVRKYYHLYSWFAYDDLKRQSKFAYIMLYAGPILANVIVAFVINALVANGVLDQYETFWNRFVFYGFYFVLFDAVPMKTANGMPNNGMIIYEMLRYGKRTDYNDEPFLPSTTEVEEQYEEEMEKVEELKGNQKDIVEDDEDFSAEQQEKERREKEDIEESKEQDIEDLKEAEKLAKKQHRERKDQMPD